MSIRNNNLGSINKPGFNALGAQTNVTTYTYELYSWGANNYGQLGLGNQTYRSSPNQVGALTNWSKLAGGDYHTVAIKTDGTLWAWGQGTSGQLGIGGILAKSSPNQVGALTTWSKIAGGGYYTLAVKTDGTLWSWGANVQGQLGLGDSGAYTERVSPVQVGALTTWLNVAAGYSFSMATKTDGTLWTWGRNDVGQLGDGTSVNKSSPVQVGALTTWSTILCGSYHAIAIKTDGTLWAWGYNNAGQLGLGNSVDKSSPNQVGALANWSTAAGGYAFTIARKTDGTLWSWGSGSYGQLGLGNTTYYSSPKQVGALTNWLNVASGRYSSFSFSTAIKTDGTLWAWGRGNNGQLGLSNTTNYSSPKQVGALTTWFTLAGGGADFSIALKY